MKLKFNMEYRLLKTIESSQPLLLPKETMPRLTPYPANNCVNPGLGQIARLYSFYVPLYSKSHLHEIHKNKPNVEEAHLSLNQEGKGQEEKIQTALETPENSETKNEDDELNPIEFNERKRKQLGSAIQESFLHPKVIKTDTILLQKPKKQTKSVSENQDNNKLKPLKHKFQFY